MPKTEEELMVMADNRNKQESINLAGIKRRYIEEAKNVLPEYLHKYLNLNPFIPNFIDVKIPGCETIYIDKNHYVAGKFWVPSVKTHFDSIVDAVTAARLK